MIKNVASHQEYQAFVKEYLSILFLARGQLSVLLLFKDVFAKLWLTDLSPAISHFTGLYAASGRPARDPVALFRSLLLMRVLKVVSLDVWVKQMRSFPLWAILSGFPPGDVPGVGTFYDFAARLWPGSSPHINLKVHHSRKKPKKGKKGQKAPVKRPGAVDRLVNHFLVESHVKPGPYDALHLLFKDVFVMPSARLGLLGDTRALSVAGDGTSVRTGGGRYGKSLCGCRKRGIYRCDCLRRFSDADASWGWDSYREEYFYGRSLYFFTAVDSPHDLPLYLNFFYAQRHDSVCFVPAWVDLVRLYPEFSFARCLLDSAHDAYAIYRLLRHYGVDAFIDLNKRNEGNVVYKDDISLSPDGIPICSGGHIMAYHGPCYGRMRHKWRCPKSRKSWGVVCDRNCSASDYGRVFYTYEEDNLRFFTRLPRNSPAWKGIYKGRTGVERTNKRAKCDYQLEQKKRRSTRDWFLEALLASSCLHMDAWAQNVYLDVEALFLQWAGEMAA